MARANNTLTVGRVQSWHWQQLPHHKKDSGTRCRLCAASSLLHLLTVHWFMLFILLLYWLPPAAAAPPQSPPHMYPPFSRITTQSSHSPHSSAVCWFWPQHLSSVFVFRLRTGLVLYTPFSPSIYAFISNLLFPASASSSSAVIPLDFHPVLITFAAFFARYLASHFPLHSTLSCRQPRTFDTRRQSHFSPLIARTTTP